VVISPLYGLPVDWEALEERAKAYGAVLIEDSAQGHGATWCGRRLGSLGAVSVLSFGRGKGWSGGSGGALLVRGDLASAFDLGQSALVDELVVLVKALAQWSLGRPSLYGIPAAIPWLGLGETRYREPRPAARITRAGAALVSLHHDAAKREATIRRTNAAALLEAIASRPEIQTYPGLPEAEPGYLRLPLRLPQGLAGFADPREALLAGIAPSYPSPLGDLPAVRARLVENGRGPTDLAGAKELARSLVTLPTHSWVGEAARARLLRLLHSY
jgi:dTDP-4-amino-4,6-dideoxygalactose transaminase